MPTRREWLKFAAGFLSLVGWWRRFFAPPPEVVEVTRERFSEIFMSEYRRRLHTDGPLTELLAENADGMTRLLLDVPKGGRIVRYARPWERHTVTVPHDATKAILSS